MFASVFHSQVVCETDCINQNMGHLVVIIFMDLTGVAGVLPSYI